MTTRTTLTTLERLTTIQQMNYSPLKGVGAIFGLHVVRFIHDFMCPHPLRLNVKGMYRRQFAGPEEEGEEEEEEGEGVMGWEQQMAYRYGPRQAPVRVAQREVSVRH